MGTEKLCDQDREMVEGLLVENEEYLDSLHNDADRSFAVVTDLRVGKFTWQYDGGKPKLKSGKNFTYDNIRRCVYKINQASGELHILLELQDNEVVELLKMPDHFTKEVTEFIGLVTEGATAFHSPETQKRSSNVGAILNNLDDLVKLAQLRQMGVIEEDEFLEAKVMILRRG